MPVTSVKPDPVVWEMALETAGGDWRRLEVVTPTNIRIHNNARR